MRPRPGSDAWIWLWRLTGAPWNWNRKSTGCGGARFTADEAALPWQRFETLDARLQADCDQFEPMMHVTSTRYRFYDMPEDFEVDDFIASWG